MTRKELLPSVKEVKYSFDVKLKGHWCTRDLFKKLDLLYRLAKASAEPWAVALEETCKMYKEDPKLLQHHANNIRKYLDRLIGHDVMFHDEKVLVIATVPGSVQVVGEDRHARFIEDVEFLNEIKGFEDD